ncbi:unnamed protein product [Microthlaspi erraticum]|uniref:Peptidase C1A papain C-terminal domain-containing protein n=1 Tax=Microthlaspi erraticum TaxID=1685480 RepID=A0A6D2K119_9BRAS|nr:unnamed protein product [Microthlaspi erraticum]
MSDYLSLRGTNKVINQIIDQQEIKICWAICLARQFTSLLRAEGILSDNQEISIQYLVNQMKSLVARDDWEGGIDSLQLVQRILLNGVVLENYCPLTFDLASTNPIGGYAGAEKFAAIMHVHTSNQYTSPELFEAAISQLRKTSTITCVVRGYASMHMNNGFDAYVPTLADHAIYELDRRIGDHCMLITGEGFDSRGIPYWEVQDSYGVRQGDAGYIRIAKGVVYAFVELIVFRVGEDPGDGSNKVPEVGIGKGGNGSFFHDEAKNSEADADGDKKSLNVRKDQSFLKDTQSCDDEEILVSSIEEKEEVLQPRESPETKYNLRKSLAWDNAFITSDGVLEPEELTSMMESNNKSERKGLPTIEEDVNRSTESISTFQSDCTVENSQELVLFEDVRASIQRSSAKGSGAATPGKYNELGETEVATSPTSSTLDVVASQEQLKPKASPKKLSIRAQGLGKATKQPVATRGLSTSISKPPNGVSKVRPALATTSTKRASVDMTKTKLERNPKFPAGKEPLGTRISISRSARPTLPKHAVPKSTIRSSTASKNELTSSCSSLESCASASSSASHKASLVSTKKKNDPSSRLASQSLANRSTSRGIMGQPRIPPHPTNMTTKSKLASSVPSRASASGGNMAKSNQKTVSGEKPVESSKDESVVQADAKEGTIRISAFNSGGLVPSGSMKASGLRVPSPKIGFFDGARHGSSSSASKKSGKSQANKSPIQVSSNSKTKASSSPKLQNKLYSKISAEDQLEV